jgi:asparagine synthase (glutamine-hydrolysing)
MMVGWPTGRETRGLPDRTVAHGRPPADVLRSLLRRALERPPCVIAFSGGVDSSALLALALDVSRRDGLPAPLAVTYRFPADAVAQETEWQQRVVQHVGRVDWQTVDITDEKDVLAPHARIGLRRRGLLWPATVYGHQAAAVLARGGSLVLGEGGDEILGPKRISPFTAYRRYDARLDGPLLREMTRSLAPRPARLLTAGHDARRLEGPWLAASVRRHHRRALRRDAADEPFAWPDATWALLSRRSGRVAMHNLRHVLHEDHDVELAAPFLDPAFVSALCWVAGSGGFVNRGHALNQLVGGLLPEAVLRRASKAYFNASTIGEAGRDFATSWDGRGLDPAVVTDVESLRRAWLHPAPRFSSLGPLQAAWLAGRGSTGAAVGHGSSRASA